jgi:hypothetical protein
MGIVAAHARITRYRRLDSGCQHGEYATAFDAKRGRTPSMWLSVLPSPHPTIKRTIRCKSVSFGQDARPSPKRSSCTTCRCRCRWRSAAADGVWHGIVVSSCRRMPCAMRHAMRYTECRTGHREPPHYRLVARTLAQAGLVKLADTLALGASARKGVKVRVLYPAPSQCYSNMRLEETDPCSTNQRHRAVARCRFRLEHSCGPLP